jgi:ribonuclease-3
MSRTSRADSVESLADLLEQLPDDLSRQAFTHASWVEHRAESYERLAFLGDVVLSLAVSTDLFPRFERYGAGRLTKLRAQAVSQGACAEVARQLGVPERLRAAAPPGPGSAAETLVSSERVLASVCEAVIGAAYLAWGIERVAPAVVSAFREQVDEAFERPDDFKSDLQERLAQRGEIVAYRLEAEDGPAHDRRFVVVAEVLGIEVGRGEGRSKKSAEQAAALAALDRMEAAS